MAGLWVIPHTRQSLPTHPPAHGGGSGSQLTGPHEAVGIAGESSGNRGAPGGSTASSTRTNPDPIMFLTLKQGKALPALDTAAQFSSQQLWLTPQGPRDAESHLPAEG